MPQGSFFNTCVFFVRHITAFLWLGTLDSPSAICLGQILNSKIPPKKDKILKNVTLNRPWKYYLFTVWELKQKAGGCLVLPQLGICVQVTEIQLCACPCLGMTMTVKAPRVMIWKVQINLVSRWIHRYGICE